MRALRRYAAIYATTFRTNVAINLAYRGAVVIWLLGLLLEPIVYLVVWTTVARAQGGTVGGFTTGEFAAYFTVLMIVNQLTFTWQFHFFEWRVRTGYFSPVLLRPLHPIHADVSETLAFKAVTLTIVIPAAIFLVLSFGATARTEPWHLLAFVPSLVLAMALRFLVEWTLALIAFWVTRTAAINQAYYVLVLFLSGQVAPLGLFPPAIQVVASVLPFRWMVAFPIEVATGRLTGPEILFGYGVQLAWILAAFLMMRVAWRAGVRRYSAVGA